MIQYSKYSTIVFSNTVLQYCSLLIVHMCSLLIEANCVDVLGSEYSTGIHRSTGVVVIDVCIATMRYSVLLVLLYYTG